ncbi:hypothetical protein SH1V18_20990 [Vallitalea longa]|uniref:DUF4279 domain-containing protein n=1 Tax=Vallitalea longa TaxID=2936439 RepID=A0A9W5YCY8_9FIRM|nr:DUF4279 domain-containing protein [Vallitalea longa]GKX29619.1 hypothetical protein SH1V18_20990 [Vallitalea longa]
MSTTVNAEFIIDGADFKPNIITNKLNIQPTEQYEKGDKVHNRNITRNSTCWTYSLGEEESIDINEQISKLIYILNDRNSILKWLNNKYNIDYLILVTIKVEDDIRPVMSIKAPVIKFLYDVGAELDIDMYDYS